MNCKSKSRSISDHRWTEDNIYCDCGAYDRPEGGSLMFLCPMCGPNLICRGHSQAELDQWQKSTINRKETKMDKKTLVAEYTKILQEMTQIVQMKNTDYAGPEGDALSNFAFVQTLSKGAISREMGVIIRMTDKLARVMTLTQQEAKVTSEKIEDTLMDLANYAILLIVMHREKQNANS